MLNTLKLYNNLKKTMNEDAAREISETLGAIYEDLKNTVTKEDFNELKQIVIDSKQETKKEISRLDAALSELADAQKETKLTLKELAEAQKRTEIKVEELAEAQKRTEIKVEELAEAQKRTQYELTELTKTVKVIQKDLGGLSMSVGYGLEDKIMPFMKNFAFKEYNITAENVERTFIEYPDGNHDELNIFLSGKDQNGKKIYLIGECKAQPGKKDFEKFNKVLERVSNHLEGEKKAFFVGFTFHPLVEKFARKTYPHIKLMKSYEFELNYKG